MTFEETTDKLLKGCDEEIKLSHRCGERYIGSRLYCSECQRAIAQKLESEKMFLEFLSSLRLIPSEEAFDVEKKIIDLCKSTKKLEGAEK